MLAAYPPADITVERIGDLLDYDLDALLAAARDSRIWTKVLFDTFVSDVRDERDVERCGHFHQVGERIGLHLAHHLASVCLHRDLADAELDRRPVCSTGRRRPMP